MIDAEQERAREYVAELVRQTGLAVSEIARRAGLAPSTLTRIYPESVVKYTLSARTLAKLHRAFPMALENPSRAPQRGDSSGLLVRSTPTEPHGIDLFNLQVAEQGVLRPAHTDDLELLEGGFETSLRKLHAHLLNDEARYAAIYMPSESMEPRFRAAEILIIDRFRPPAVNAEVLIRFTKIAAKSFFCIAKLTDQDHAHIDVIQYKYGRLGRIPKENIESIYTIVGMIDTEII